MKKKKYFKYSFIIIIFWILFLPFHIFAQERIASLNLCGDQYLLAFAKPEQIASLSPWSHNPAMAFYVDEAKHYPRNNGSAEALINEKVDMIIDGAFSSKLKHEILKRQNIKVLTLSQWSNLEEGKKEILHIARLLKNDQEGYNLVNDIDTALGKTKNIISKPLRVIVIFRRGYIPSVNSTINILLEHFGFELYQRYIGMEQGGFINLEKLIQSPPDYAIVDESTEAVMDHGTALLAHPALMKILPEEKRIIFPEKLFMCGGPTVPKAIYTLSGQIKSKIGMNGL